MIISEKNELFQQTERAKEWHWLFSGVILRNYAATRIRKNVPSIFFPSFFLHLPDVLEIIFLRTIVEKSDFVAKNEELNRVEQLRTFGHGHCNCPTVLLDRLNFSCPVIIYQNIRFYSLKRSTYVGLFCIIKIWHIGQRLHRNQRLKRD